MIENDTALMFCKSSVIADTAKPVPEAASARECRCLEDVFCEIGDGRGVMIENDTALMFCKVVWLLILRNRRQRLFQLGRMVVFCASVF